MNSDFKYIVECLFVVFIMIGFGGEGMHLNKAHVPGKGLQPPLPKDAEEVFKNAVPGDAVDPLAPWFGKMQMDKYIDFLELTTEPPTLVCIEA